MAIITYEHYGALVFVDENLKGKHRENCLCWKCGSFKPGMPENCPIAQKLYKICVKESLVTPVYECPVFVELPKSPEATKEPEGSWSGWRWTTPH
jgi:hypothetical protein